MRRSATTFALAVAFAAVCGIAAPMAQPATQGDQGS